MAGSRRCSGIGLVRDLARSEATITAIINSIGEGVLVIGRDHAISAANPAAVTILGVTHPDDLVGMGPQEFSRRFTSPMPRGASSRRPATCHSGHCPESSCRLTRRTCIRTVARRS